MRPSGPSKFHFYSSEKLTWSHWSYQVIVSRANDKHSILWAANNVGLASFTAYWKLPTLLIVLQIVFLQTLKPVCLIISVLEYFPIDASCKTLLSPLDDNALGLPLEFCFAVIITQLLIIMHNSFRSYTLCYTPTTQNWWQ